MLKVSSEPISPAAAKKGYGRRKTLFVIGVMISVLIGGMWLFASRNDPARRAEIGPMPGPDISFEEALQDPLDFGREVGLSQARQKIPYHVSLPHHDSANPDNLDAVFISPANHAAERFTSDVLIILQRADFTDPASEFAGLIASGSVTNGRLDTVRGHPALIMEPNTDATGTNPGSLQFVVNDISITVYGRNLSGARLKEIAETIE